MSLIITDPGEITSEWLTEYLFSNNFLTHGRIIQVKQTPFTTLVSFFVRLELTFSDDISPAISSRLLLKMSHVTSPVYSALLGKREVEFYLAVMNAHIDLPVPRCYGAAYSPESGRFHLLLEDVAQTHGAATPWPMPPSLPLCEQVIDTLARVHAHWWGKLRLGEAIGPRFPDIDAARAYAASEASNYERFADFLGDALSLARRHTYETVLAASYLFEERIPGARPLTLNHGDAHLWNYLYPHDSANGAILIIDWDDCRIDIGTADIAYMIAQHWYPERRERFEKHLLQRYHAQLLAHGVPTYSWEDCWNDYRLAVIECLMTPIQQWSEGVPASVWWGHLERGLLAFTDLNCMDLLPA